MPIISQGRKGENKDCRTKLFVLVRQPYRESKYEAMIKFAP